MAQQPLELILARNLIGSLSTPAVLVDSDGAVAFFNQAAGRLIGRQFEETGRLSPEEWSERFRPVDEHDQPVSLDELGLVRAVEGGRPGSATFGIVGSGGGQLKLQVTAMPLSGISGFHGAVVLLLPLDGEA